MGHHLRAKKRHSLASTEYLPFWAALEFGLSRGTRVFLPRRQVQQTLTKRQRNGETHQLAGNRTCTWSAVKSSGQPQETVIQHQRSPLLKSTTYAGWAGPTVALDRDYLSNENMVGQNRLHFASRTPHIIMASSLIFNNKCSVGRGPSRTIA